MIWDGSPFGGAKMAAIFGDALLVYARDDITGIPFPGMLDLPGGGREGSESPAMCACRELHEEFGLTLPESRLWWARPFPSLHPPGGTGWFLAANITQAEVASIRFGNEGHSPQLLGIDAFLAANDAIAPLQLRLRLVLETPGNSTVSQYHRPKTPLLP